MNNSVVIKGNKSGMTVILDPDVPYEELIRELADRFNKSAKFWGSVEMTLTIAGRHLTPEQEMEVVNVITGNSQITILSIVDEDIERLKKSEKVLDDRRIEMASSIGQIIRGNVVAGEHYESKCSLIVIGDLLKGGSVKADGNVIILGDLRGTAWAGASGNSDAVITALEMHPLKLQISDLTMSFPDKGGHPARGAAYAYVEDRKIFAKSLKKSMFDVIKSK